MDDDTAEPPVKSRPSRADEIAMSSTRLWLSSVVAALAVSVAALIGFVGDVTRTPALEALTLGALLIAVILSIAWVIALRHPKMMANEHARTQLEEQALTDSLTGLRNHRAFHEDLARELAVAEARGLSVGLALVDLNGLKKANDRYGHQAGDQLILAMADVLRQTVRERDLAFRVGGDEFAVILPRETNWGAFRFAQRLQAMLRARPAGEGLAAAIGVSATHGQTRDELIHEADLALIAAKRSGQGALIYTDDLGVREQGYESEGRVERTDLVCAALAKAADSGRPAGAPRSEAVGAIAAQIAVRIGFDADQVSRIRRAAMLLDAWAICVDDAPAEGMDQADFARRVAVGAGLTREAEWIVQCHSWGTPSQAQSAESTVLRVARTYAGLGDSDDAATQVAQVSAELTAGGFSEHLEPSLAALESVVGPCDAADSGGLTDPHRVG